MFGRQATAITQFVVIVRAQRPRVALAVDDLIGQRELVTRPLPAIVSEASRSPAAPRWPTAGSP